MVTIKCEKSQIHNKLSANFKFQENLKWNKQNLAHAILALVPHVMEETVVPKLLLAVNAIHAGVHLEVSVAKQELAVLRIILAVDVTHALVPLEVNVVKLNRAALKRNLGVDVGNVNVHLEANVAKMEAVEKLIVAEIMTAAKTNLTNSIRGINKLDFIFF